MTVGYDHEEEILAPAALKAPWIWNLAKKQFKNADQRIDLFHVKEHLRELAAELHGRGAAEAECSVSGFVTVSPGRFLGLFHGDTNCFPLLSRPSPRTHSGSAEQRKTV